MKTFMETLRNNRKLLVAVIIAILVQVFTGACASLYGYSAFVVASQIGGLISLLLVMGSFVFILNKKPKPAIACAVASAFVVMIGYLLVCYLVYLNYRDAHVNAFGDESFLVWSDLFVGYLLFIILNILPQIWLLVFLLRKAKNAQLWALIAVLLTLPSLIMLLVDGAYWWYCLPNISLALLYYFGYSSTDTTQQAGILEKIKVHFSDARNHTKGVNGMNKMYTNIGGKIKMLAKILCVLLSIMFIVCGICVFATDYRMRGVGIVIILVGPLLSWVCSFFAYGFGELIEKTTIIAEAAAKENAKKDTVE